MKFRSIKIDNFAYLLYLFILPDKFIEKSIDLVDSRRFVYIAQIILVLLHYILYVITAKL